jgi:glyoxylase-like metal-dependent hydrolase (beta-lactamase superfamily II)
VSANYTKNGLRFDVFTSSPCGLASNAVLISGTHEAVLVDTTFLSSDAPGLIDMVREVGKSLSTILISHAHPDHYGALSLIREAFPDVRILARQGVIDGILEWPAKLVHWQEMLGDDLALEMVYPEPLTGSELQLEGRSIQFVDLPICETVHATAFYIPSCQVLVAADLIYSKTHPYMGDTNNPESWIAAIEQARALGPIERVYPGHGPAGGTELFDAHVQWLRDYAEVAQPRVRFTDVAREMMRRYPDHALAILLWTTRGPGFGLAGWKEIGMPAELIAG